MTFFKIGNQCNLEKGHFAIDSTVFFSLFLDLEKIHFAKASGDFSCFNFCDFVKKHFEIVTPFFVTFKLCDLEKSHFAIASGDFSGFSTT